MTSRITNLHTERGDFEKFYTTYADTIALRHRVALAEITVCCGEDVLSNTRAACRKAIELVASGYFRRALVINCASSHRWVMSTARRLAQEEPMRSSPWENVDIMTLAQGRLSHELMQVRNHIEREGVDVMLINSWEFASANARYREEAIFALREIAMALNLTVIVYSQAAPKEYKPGCIMRGTLGRLSALAQIIGPVEVPQTDEPPARVEEHSEHFVSEEGHLNGQPPLEHGGREVEFELVE
jgi:hypothetical protein